MLTQEVDLRDLAKVFRHLATINRQVLDHLQLILKEIKLPY